MKNDDDFDWFPLKWRIIFGVMLVALAIYLYVVGVC